MRPRLVIASRGSALAMAQSEWVAAQLRLLSPKTEVVILHVETKGDKIRDVPLAQVGGKGLFTKEIELALLAHDADLAVHSLKDLPTELPEGLCLAAVPPREDPRDVLITRDGRPLHELAEGATVGTSSLRRRLHLHAARPDLNIVDLRGNVPTRLQRVAQGPLDATILAAAGLNRLGLAQASPHVPLPPEVLLPAVGQGALGIEARSEDAELLALLAQLEHAPTRQAVNAERGLLSALGGGCQSPLGAYATVEGETLTLRACWFPREDAPPRAAEATGPADAPEVAVARVAAQLRAADYGAAFTGKRVLLMRPREQSAELAARLEASGAEVVVLPTIGIRTLRPATPLPAPEALDWLVFTSANGVRGFAAAVADPAAYRACSICAVGPATSAAVRALGLPVTLTPDAFRADAIVPAVQAATPGLAQTRWLWPRGNRARDGLAEALRAAGASVEDPVVYETVSLTPDAAEIDAALAPMPQLVLFTSGSTVESLHAALTPAQREALQAAAMCVSIGPQTSEAMARLGWPIAAEADSATLEGQLAAAAGLFAQQHVAGEANARE